MIILTFFIMSAGPVLSQEQNPDLQRGIAEFRQENFEEAIDNLLKAIVAEPTSSLPSYYLGKTYKSLQNYREAKKYFRNAMNLPPKIKEVYLELAEVYYELGELQNAMDVLMKAERESVRPGQTAYMKGLVLLAMNKNIEAVESFQKAGELSPELSQAVDYQMGLAYLNDDQLDKSEQLFNNVIQADPDSDMSAFSRNYIAEIEKKKRDQAPWRFYLGLHFQYDDNVILSPSSDVAASEITDEDDYREVLTGGIEYFPEIEGPLDFNAHYSLYISNYHDLSEFDVNSHSLALVPGYEINNVSKADLAFSFGYSWVDYDKYLATAAISPTYTHVLSNDSTLQTYVSYKRKDFLQSPPAPEEDRDADEYSLNFNWFYFFGQKIGTLVPFTAQFDLSSFSQSDGYVNLFYKVSKNDADGINWDYFGSRFIVTTLFPLHEKVKLRISGDGDYRDYDNTHTFFNKERRDIRYGLSALLFYRFAKNFNLQLLYVYDRQDSNVTIYDYTRNIYSIGIEWRY
jgi:tetratricopeptide (TPR) repeat protein